MYATAQKQDNVEIFLGGGGVGDGHIRIGLCVVNDYMAMCETAYSFVKPDYMYTEEQRIEIIYITFA